MVFSVVVSSVSPYKTMHNPTGRILSWVAFRSAI